VAEAQLAAWLAWWRAALERPATTALFIRPAPQAGVRPELWRERRFLVLEAGAAPGPEAGAELLVPGAFDRVVVWRDAAGVPVRAEIIDFKTDAVAAGDEERLVARVAHYAPQMEAYRRAVVAQTGLPTEVVACRILFLEADVVRDVPPPTSQRP
jgi:ATP-dependent helicase/nuclease subunit A